MSGEGFTLPVANGRLHFPEPGGADQDRATRDYHPGDHVSWFPIRCTDVIAAFTENPDVND